MEALFRLASCKQSFGITRYYTSVRVSRHRREYWQERANLFGKALDPWSVRAQAQKVAQLLHDQASFRASWAQAGMRFHPPV